MRAYELPDELHAEICRVIGDSWVVTRKHELKALECCRGRGADGIALIGALMQRANEVLAAAPTLEIEHRIRELDEKMNLARQRERTALGYSEGRQVGNRFYGPRKVSAARRPLAELCRREIDANRNERERLDAELKRRAHAKA